MQFFSVYPFLSRATNTPFSRTFLPCPPHFSAFFAAFACGCHWQDIFLRLQQFGASYLAPACIVFPAFFPHVGNANAFSAAACHRQHATCTAATLNHTAATSWLSVFLSFHSWHFNYIKEFPSASLPAANGLKLSIIEMTFFVFFLCKMMGWKGIRVVK